MSYSAIILFTKLFVKYCDEITCIVSVSDVIFTLQLIAGGDYSGLTEEQTAAADVNGDEKIDVSDVIRILQYLASPNTPLIPQ